MPVREDGFILLEVLAALVILALAAVLLTDALQERARLAERLRERARLSAAADLLLTARALGGETEGEVRALLRRAGIRASERIRTAEDGVQRVLELERDGRVLELVLPEGRR